MAWRLHNPHEEIGGAVSLSPWMAGQARKTQMITLRKHKHESQTPIPQPTKIANQQTIAI